MKKIILILFCCFILNKSKAQTYFSKLYDVNQEWEILTDCYFNENNNLVLMGHSINFFVSDSSKFGKLFMLQLDSNFNVSKKIDIREVNGKYTIASLIKNLKATILYGKADTSGNDIFGAYYLSSINKDFSLSNTRKLNFFPNTDRTNKNAFNINNKLYFFYADYTTFVASKVKLSMQCLDTNGNLLWGKVYKDKRCVAINAVQTADNNFIVAGLKYYGESLGAQDSAFAWYAKIDTIGNIIWEKDLVRGGPFLADDLWVGNANDEIYLSGSLLANISILPLSLHRDSSYCNIAKINEQTGDIIWKKQIFTQITEIQGLYSVIKQLQYHKGSLYALVDHYASERENPRDLSQYVMLAKFDLQGNILWKRLFSNWYASNRAYSLTALEDGFLICGDSKDSTHEKGDSDAWLIKTDTNGCIIPGCNAKDNIPQIIHPEKVFTVYPNPTQNSINIKVNETKAKLNKIFIYNLQGNLLMTVLASNTNQETIETQNLTNGTYLLVIELTDGSQAVKKLVVEK